MSTEKMPRDCHPIDAVNPHDGKRWQVFLRDSMMDRAIIRGPGVARELGYTVPESFLTPKAVFRGVRAEGEPNWLCYVARPSQAYDYRDGTCRKAWHGEVFLIYVDDFRIIRDAFWVKADQNDPDLPENHDTRFNDRLL